MRWRPVVVLAPLGGLGILLRILRRPRLHLRLLDAIELAQAGLPLDTLKEEGSDWELIDEGDDTKGGFKWADPHKCECGLFWDATDNSAFFNQKPNAVDIANCYAGFDYPKKPSEKCDEPCIAVEQSRHKSWKIFKNKKTGQFFLFCSKRIQWHCEKVEG
jgi:hypothetical protein